MTLENLISRLDDELARAGVAVDAQRLISIFYPNNIEAGQLLERASRARLLRGRLHTNFIEFEGNIRAIADDTRPVWH